MKTLLTILTLMVLGGCASRKKPAPKPVVVKAPVTSYAQKRRDCHKTYLNEGVRVENIIKLCDKEFLRDDK